LPNQKQAEIMNAARASLRGFTCGEQANISDTYATHANGHHPIGACASVSITALAVNGKQSSKTFFNLGLSQTSADIV
jgi:hypothetical protein